MSRFMLTAVVPALFLSITPASADALDTSFKLALYPYAVLKRAAVSCDKPISEYIDYKTRVMEILGKIPNANLRAADRDLEEHNESEARYDLECTDVLLDLYQQTKSSNAERSLKSLNDAVNRKLRD